MPSMGQALELLVPTPPPEGMRLVWGTVNGAGTQVTLDGETTALPAATPSLVPLLPGVRAAVMRHGKSTLIVGMLGGSTPPGTILEYAGSTAPPGYLMADGSAVSRTTYAALFAVIGTTYGTGDGSTTFNVPNRKGRVGVGRDSGQTEFDTLGETGGAKTHTLTVGEMPAHTHQDPTTTGQAGSYELAGLPPTNPSAGYDYGIQSAPTSSTGGGGAHNNLQPYLVLNYIVKV